MPLLLPLSLLTPAPLFFAICHVIRVRRPRNAAYADATLISLTPCWRQRRFILAMLMARYKSDIARDVELI